MGHLALGPSCKSPSGQRWSKGTGGSLGCEHASSPRVCTPRALPPTTHRNHFTSGWRVCLFLQPVFGLLSHTLPCGYLGPPAPPPPVLLPPTPGLLSLSSPPTPPKARPASSAASSRVPPAPGPHPRQSPPPPPLPCSPPIPQPSLLRPQS